MNAVMSDTNRHGEMKNSCIATFVGSIFGFIIFSLISVTRAHSSALDISTCHMLRSDFPLRGSEDGPEEVVWGL